MTLNPENKLNQCRERTGIWTASFRARYRTNFPRTHVPWHGCFVTATIFCLMASAWHDSCQETLSVYSLNARPLRSKANSRFSPSI